MSSFMSNKFLKHNLLRETASPVGTRRGRTIEGDFPCGACGYNLRGLVYGAKCPECGVAMDESRRWTGGDFLPRINVLLPVEGSKRLRLQVGFLLASFAMFAMMAIGLVANMPWQTIDLLAYSWAMAGATGVWLAASILLTPGEFKSYGKRIILARRFVLFAALAWPLGHLAMATSMMGSFGRSQEVTLYIAWVTLRIVGASGMLTLFLMLSIASWDIDRDDVGKRFVTAFWGVLFFGALSVLIPRGVLAASQFGGLTVSLCVPVVIIWAIFLCFAIWSMLTLFASVRWVSADMLDKGGRIDRVRATRKELDRAVAANVRKFGNAKAIGPDAGPE